MVDCYRSWRPPIKPSTIYLEYNNQILRAIRKNIKVLHHCLYGGTEGIQILPSIDTIMTKPLKDLLKLFTNIRSDAKHIICDWSDTPATGDKYLLVNHYGVLSQFMTFNDKLVIFIGQAREMIHESTKLFRGE